MTPQMLYALFILVVAIIFFVTEWLRVDVVALGVVVALMLPVPGMSESLLSTAQALSGFSNSAVLTIAGLFVVGGAVLNTGLAAWIGERILIVAGHSEIRLIVVIMVAVAILSGFMSDTGTVAVLLPAIVSMGRSARISASKLLIPLSYGALLGGAATLIGTPPNIIVSDLLRESGSKPFEFFDFTPVGLILLIVGVVFMAVVGRRILPDNQTTRDVSEFERPQDLVNLYQLAKNLHYLRVRRGSEMANLAIKDTRLRSDFRVTVIEILRAAAPLPVARLGKQRLVVQSDEVYPLFPTPNTNLKADDILIVQGEQEDIHQACDYWDLSLQPPPDGEEMSIINRKVGVAEVLLPPRSSLIGKNVVEGQFGVKYNLIVLRVCRPSGSLGDEQQDVKETELRFGDTLIVQGAWKNILALKKHPRDFVVMGQPESMVGAPHTSKAPVAFLVLLGMLILLVTGLAPVATASMLAGLVMVLTGCLSMDEAYEAIDWKSIVLVAGMLPMSIALENVGLVNAIAQGVTSSLGDSGPLVVLAALFLLTSVFTQVLSNTATTVLIAPIALVTAQKLGVQPQAFMLAVAIAASMAFATPVASPVNTLVLGAGRYRFSDYIKIGVPLILIMLVVVLLVLPIFWPF